jgi:photosystem II stability/assembly factor-like uncharacterized protein
MGSVCLSDYMLQNSWIRRKFLFGIPILFLCFTSGVRAQTLQWVNVIGPPVGAMNCFAVDSTKIYAGTADSGIYISTNNGMSWSMIGGSLDLPSTSALWANGANLIAGTFTGGLYRSNNFGASWEHISAGDSDYDWTLFDDSGTVFAGTLDSGIYRTMDMGENWLQVNNGITFFSIRAFTAIGGILLAGSHGGGIFRSTDNGDSWTPSSTGLPEGFVHALAVSGQTMFAGTHYDAVYRSTDSGVTWDSAGNGIVNPYVTALAVSGNSVFVSTSDGIYQSTNMGDLWVKQMAGIPDSSTVLSLAVNGTTIVAGTSSAGLFRTTLANEDVSLQPASTGIPFSVVPNPVLSNSIIHYLLDHPGEATIAIFDPLGREVMQPLSNEWQNAGEHEATINAGNLAPGIYECRLSAGDNMTTAKMAVVR